VNIMLKKLLFITALCFTLGACNNQDKPQPNNTPAPTVTPTEDLGEKEVYDKTSINPNLKKRLIELNGVEYIILQPYINKNIETGEIIDMRTGGPAERGYERGKSHNW